MCAGGEGGPAVSTSTKSVKVHLTCEPSPGQVLLCACYGEHFILCVCYVFVSGLPYSAHLMDSTSHHDSPPPSSQIEWMYIHKLTEATIASCVVVESSVLYMNVYVDSCCLSCLVFS